jgi:DNA polymerase III delta prime subunit
MIETYSAKTRFILTGNYIERFIEPIISRCTELDLSPPEKKVIAKHMVSILEKENIEYELGDVAKIINQFYPDFRRIINYIQKSSLTGTLTIDTKAISSSDYTKEVLDELSKPKPNFNTLRQIIANSGYSEFDELFRFLYDNATKYSPGNEGQIAFIINTHLYQAQFRVDKEINVASCLNAIIELK